MNLPWMMQSTKRFYQRFISVWGKGISSEIAVESFLELGENTKTYLWRKNMKSWKSLEWAGQPWLILRHLKLRYLSKEWRQTTGTEKAWRETKTIALLLHKLGLRATNFSTILLTRNRLQWFISIIIFNLNYFYWINLI